MEKISKEDALTLENFGLKAQMLEMARAAFMADVKARYKLEDGDSVNPQTLEITRAVKPAEEKKE